MKEQNSNQSEDSSYLQTVGRALEMLDLVGRMPGITLSEATRHTKMSTTVAYRLLYTLSLSGFLMQDVESKRYYPGDKALLLGFQAIDTREIKRIAQHHMWDFYEKTGENCILTVPCANQSLCIEKISSLRDSYNSVRVGGLYPLHRGASNRVLLAYMPKDEQQRYLNGLNLPAESLTALQHDLEQAAALGYDYSVGMLTPGRFGLAFPIFDRRGNLAGALSTGGYIADTTDEIMVNTIRQVGRVAAQVNTAMGAPSSLR